MNHTPHHSHSPEEQEALERVRRKMLRLMIISVGIMLVGIFAVVGAIIYKFGYQKPNEQSDISSPSLQVTGQSHIQDHDKTLEHVPTRWQRSIDANLPKGAKLLRVDWRGSVIMMQVELPDGRPQIQFISLETGETLSQVNAQAAD